MSDDRSDPSNPECPEDDQWSPWHYADLEGRGYLTPEDASAAIGAGASVWQVAQAVLEAVEAKRAEDASCCAFVALSRDPAWKRRKP